MLLFSSFRRFFSRLSFWLNSDDSPKKEKETDQEFFDRMYYVS